MDQKKSAPRIEKLHAKMGCLERRQSFLERSLQKHDALPDSHPDKLRNENRASHDREEEAALRGAALPALRHFWRELQGEASAIVLLSALVEEYGSLRNKGIAELLPQPGREAFLDMEAVVHRARKFLEEEGVE